MSEDKDAIRRQAISKVSNSIMTLTFLAEDDRIPPDARESIKYVLEDLTRARYLLVEHEEPDGLLDELSQL